MRALVLAGSLLVMVGPAAATAQQLFVDASDRLPGGGLDGRSMHALAADVDGDGDLDIVVAREFQSNAILINDGNADFTDGSDRLATRAHDSEEVVAADFDGDGAIDLMFVSEDDATHELHLNDGTGAFSDVSARIAASSVSNGVVVFDIDGDGLPDAVLGNNGQNIVLINDGEGGFREETDRLPAADDVTQDIEAGDVDGDGDLDLIVANEGQNLVLINDGGRFADEGGMPAARTESRMANLADYDGDGDLDLFVANVSVFLTGADPQNRLYLNDGAGGFVEAPEATLPADSQQSFESKALDIDRDGDPDLLIGNTNSLSGPGNERLRALVNEDGAFIDRTADLLPATARGNVFSIAIGDYDGDGHEDLYLALRYGRDILLLAE